MKPRTHLNLLAFLAFSGCFAAYIPDSPYSPPNRLTSTSDDSVIIVRQNDYSRNSERSTSSRFVGKGTLGHQYLFPFFPVTRLYIERDRDDYLAEIILSSPIWRARLRAVSNMKTTELQTLQGGKNIVVAARFAELGATVHDLLVTRRIGVEGEIDAEINSVISHIFFSNSRYVKMGAVELIGELLETTISDKFETELQIPQRTTRAQISRQRISNTVPFIICPTSNSVTSNSTNVQRGWEEELLSRAIPFISFRDRCPSSLTFPHYLLTSTAPQLGEGEENITLDSNLTLFEVHDGNRTLIKKMDMSAQNKLENRSVTPQITALEIAAGKQLGAFLDQQ